MKRTFKLLTLTALGVLACVAVVYASGDAATAEAAHEAAGEAAHGGGHHGIPWGNFIARVINFVLFLGIIWYFAGKKVMAFFTDRKTQIADELDDLSARQAEAEEKLKNVEQGIANLEQEKKAILDEAREQGEILKAAIIEKAEKDATTLKEQAKRTAENESKAALDAIRAEMADMVVEAATKLVQEKLTDKDHDKLVDEYLTKVELQ